MTLQEPQEQYESEPLESTGEPQDPPVDSPLSDSDEYSPSNESESIEVPASETDSPVVSQYEDEPGLEADLPAESLPPSPDVLTQPEAVEGPAWYVIHCYSGYENKVRHNLEQRIETMGMKDRIFDVVIPTQEEIEVKDGKRRTVERHIFPGYVLVNMVLTEESWYVVRNTPGVTGFVGMGNNPTPLRPEEVSQIIKRMEAEAPTVKVTFKVGERVRIVDGPFNDFRGVVSEIDMERTKVRVMVSFFGRETPVELDFLQVEKS
jgi:transcriptional antiterminator NusG